jgi:DNA repair exonuclease SbcCD ATPase subunit
MIPQRIKMSGFLSYKDVQEIRFDEAPLWMLSGTNGSGKSSVFDAVTFALFGHHRGGSQSAIELINKESATLTVEFDFTSEKQLYRIRRTVKRQKNDKIASTQQVLKRTHSEIVSEAWEAISGTEYKAQFDAWIKDKIGLDYETFTSSVLLLQGKSEKLLDSTPAGRAGVLARIVDLERYQKLHGKADEKRRALKGELEGIANQLEGIRDVSEEEYAEAQAQIVSAEAARDTAQERIDTLVALEQRARNWSAIQTKLAGFRAKLTEAEKLLGSALTIQQQYERYSELKAVMPAVSTIVTERGRVNESDRKTETLTKARAAASEKRDKIEHALDQLRTKLGKLKKALAEDEAKKSKLETRLRELAGVLEKVRVVDDAEAELKRLDDELKRLPADPDGAVRALQSEQERLALLEQHVALLTRLSKDCHELKRAVGEEQAARANEARLKSEGIAAKEDFAKLEVRAKAARDDRAAKDSAAAEARALARQARELANEFTTLTGETKCRACGQPLTTAHFAKEKKDREAAAAAAEKKEKELAAAASSARKLEDELTTKEATERERLNKLREDYKEAAGSVKQHASDAQRIGKSCFDSYISLPQEYKDKFGADVPTDWAAVTYPSRNDLSDLTKQAGGIDTVKRKLKVAQEEAAKAQALRAKVESARERLARAKQALPAGDPGAVRQEYASKQTDEQSVSESIVAGKKGIASTETDIDRGQRALSETDRELTEIAGKLHTEEVSRNQSRESIERAKKALPAAWQQPLETAGLSDRSKWQDELDELAAANIEAQFTRLQAARGGLDSIRADIALLEGEAEAFPATDRCNPDEVRADIADARKALDARNNELLDAQGKKRLLDGYLQQRGELGVRYKAVDAEHNRHKLLAELLGRDRLQRHLVRRAERQIVDYANAVLDRLSGGQLFLKLVEAEAGTDKALDLECANRVTGGSAINVAFLSGSQRFRVAVALALGIGQYASKQHRPIESVIIDEGFGCLDRAGRQVMIQELQNLRGHLHCILLVSHQEEFADAFPDGYRFELHEGATRVSRFVR